MSSTPVLMLTSTNDVVAATEAARVLFGSPDAPDLGPGTQLSEAFFIKGWLRQRFVDPDAEARRHVSWLRAAHAQRPGDVHLRAAVATLQQDEEFARLWRENALPVRDHEAVGLRLARGDERLMLMET